MPNKQTRIVKAQAWKQTESETGIAKACFADPEIVTKGDDGAPLERSLGWTISTEARDRDGDRIMVAGWDLKNFRQNPVVPFAHNYSQLPVARVVSIVGDKEKKRLYAVKQFAPKEANAFADSVYQLAKLKYLRAASVGFVPRKWDEDTLQEKEAEGTRVGRIFTKQELLESSIVVVPSNPLALAEARSLHGVDLDPFKDVTERLLDCEDQGLYDRKDLEVVWQIVKGEPVSVSVTNGFQLDAHPIISTEPTITFSNPTDVYTFTLTAPSAPEKKAPKKSESAERIEHLTITIAELAKAVAETSKAAREALEAVASLSKAIATKSPEPDGYIAGLDEIDVEIEPEPSDETIDIDLEDLRSVASETKGIGATH